MSPYIPFYLYFTLYLILIIKKEIQSLALSSLPEVQNILADEGDEEETVEERLTEIFH